MISIVSLSKHYGVIKAVDNISFEVGSGEVIGFLGPNGAGKTTTMQMITCFFAPTSGNINISGYDIRENHEEIKKMIGYLPENNPLYYDLFVYDFLLFFGKLKGLKGAELTKNISDTIEKCGIKDVLSRKIETLSRGYRQRVGLAQAIIGDPQILILDEPTTGLDPNQIIEIRNLIKDLGREKTVILSTHIMQEVEQTCDRALIINNGKLVADGRIDELTGDKAEYVLETDPVMDKNLIGKFGEILSFDGSKYILKSDYDIRRNIAEICLKNNILILEFSRKKESLEEIFRKLTVEV